MFEVDARWTRGGREVDARWTRGGRKVDAWWTQGGRKVVNFCNCTLFQPGVHVTTAATKILQGAAMTLTCTVVCKIRCNVCNAI